ncbi:DEAD/DEAH box helicase [Caproiciproducens sp. MSJ-32]|uniref:DEAD/DEAH box helicase n=1 Tax=Caproiciproducens sp. MSJ-32 TaxID=2841527 RepID=UPI001C128321|nr:DEAD/DEAH box helicase [Caproiciproducens sp. MSJ-32]MBU5454532.1 DEAD/DEAH box helicase [Caproiciproducens sp. MSJ-32]
MNEIKFSDLELKDTLLRSIAEMGFEKPSQIQAEAIPIALEGYDIIGQAQTGTGKTAAFGCTIINGISKEDGLSAIILSPTRELAIQVHDELKKLSKYDNLNIVAVYGGDSISYQIKALKGNVNIVVGTPGRLLDHIRRKTLSLDNIKYLVLDEADEMLNMGFIDDLEEIIKQVPSERQTLLFSATMPDPIKKLAKRYLKKDVKHIAIKKTSMTVSKISQSYFEVSHKSRFEALCRILDFDQPKSSMIFCKTKKGVDELVEAMQARGYVVEGMHGDMSQAQRLRTLKKFKEGSLNFLVATDVAARGIDVEGVTHVINYDLPQDVESYVHRIGRTGRANREGTAYSLVSPKEYPMLKQIISVTKSEINKKKVPTVNEIFKNKSHNLLKDVANNIELSNNERFIPMAKELLEKYDAVEVIAALMKSNFKDDLFEFYTSNELKAPKADSEYVRLFFSVGRRDGITPKTIINFIKDNARVKASHIGDIDILENFSFVNVSPDIKDKVLNKCMGIKFNRRKVNIEVANKKKKR